MSAAAQREPPAHLCVGVVLYENGTEELLRLLASLGLSREVQGAPSFVTRWWDNSPTDALAATLRAQDPRGRYEGGQGNLGFGAAHNRMMAAAFADPAIDAYVCVNPDAVLHPHCLRELAGEAAAREDTGLVEARQFPDEHPKPYDPATHETAWCSGCVLLVTRRLFAELGGFDERFFMYCEDVDLSWRARAAGLSIRVAPAALAHHYTVAREHSPRREQSVRRSAAQLGAKYGHAGFAREMLAQYTALGGPPIPPPPMERPAGALVRVADFTHLFEFSEVRW